MTAISEDTVQPHDGSRIRILQTNPNPEVHFTTVPIICRQRHLCKAEVCLPGVASPGWDESVPVSLYVCTGIMQTKHLYKAEVCLPGVASPGWDESVPVSLYVLCRQRHLYKAEVCLPGVASPGRDESVPISLLLRRVYRGQVLPRHSRLHK